ncbi:Uma2 family endonuclease [Kribbella sp. VKM Ac-2527]|uniref:Uma2 family endonuclease n=1 Tax=Kribbella caucasensis TaxID=2512215 RepID=A0A4R6JJ00_9ACTN|nr:Uma2 family endonuclease [Kribbella sp. VKM Ac-2527]TDO35682.1 Uma2 family endonuclease [Kribbella sp. VKM Ac-2527]
MTDTTTTCTGEHPANQPHPDPQSLDWAPRRATCAFGPAELDALPYVGRFEIIEGALLVSHRPTLAHQAIATELATLLGQHRPDDLRVLTGPVDFRPSEWVSLQPDVLVCHRDDLGRHILEHPPFLAVEILSSATRTTDTTLKPSLYEKAGVDSYWMLDPTEQTLTVLELVNGQYAERAVVTGGEVFTADLPFPVEVVPGRLTDHPSQREHDPTAKTGTDAEA